MSSINGYTWQSNTSFFLLQWNIFHIAECLSSPFLDIDLLSGIATFRTWGSIIEQWLCRKSVCFFFIYSLNILLITARWYIELGFFSTQQTQVCSEKVSLEIGTTSSKLKSWKTRLRSWTPWHIGQWRKAKAQCLCNTVCMWRCVMWVTIPDRFPHSNFTRDTRHPVCTVTSFLQHEIGGQVASAHCHSCFSLNLQGVRELARADFTTHTF